MKKYILLILLLALFFSCPEYSKNSSNDSDYKEPTTPPAAPSNLILDTISFCRIIVTWTDNSNNESEFIIERSLNNNFSTFTEIQADANATAYSDRQQLNSNTTYYYRIKASNSAGDSNYSDIIDATTLPQPSVPTGSLVADHTVINMLRLGNIPISAIQTAKNNLHIGYGHTSHGSQLTSGMSGLVAFANGDGLNGTYNSYSDLFSWNRGGTGGALDLREGDEYNDGPMDHDCGYYPNWINETREYLDDPANYEINVIIWSWCGQASGYSEETMNEQYLEPMNELEQDYPDITFVYMTCHLNGTGLNGNLHLRNEQIRDYCTTNNKWLFDFADIESYDPDGIINFNAHFADDNCDYDDDTSLPREEDGNWAIEWQNSHTQDVDWYNCDSAHSQSLNANMKAYTAWWLWCRIAGWDGN